MAQEFVCGLRELLDNLGLQLFMRVVGVNPSKQSTSFSAQEGMNLMKYLGLTHLYSRI